MKTTSNFLTALIAAGAPGVFLLSLSNPVPTEAMLAVLTSIGLVAFAILDYSRPLHGLRLPGVIVRPKLPAVTVPGVPAARRAA